MTTLQGQERPELASWRDGATKRAIIDFVARVTAEGSAGYVAPAERIAVFDNDGTLWCEKPMYIQLDHLLRELAAAAERAYRPMIELLRYLEAHGFTNYIVSGGGRDFMRGFAQELYGIGRERVIGSTVAYAFASRDGTGDVVQKGELDVVDDGPGKPIQIWNVIGRRPILAVGNSNGDLPMLQFCGGDALPALRLLVVHDDAEREFDYTSGAEKAIEATKAAGWSVVSIKADWATVFPS